MDANRKILIYFEPSEKDMPNVISLTLSFSDLDTDVYKQKLILQVKNENETVDKYKMKEYHEGSESIREKIKKIDFNAKYDEVSDELDAETFMIKYGDNVIYTSNRAQISYILHMFKFNRLANIPKEYYSQIKDMYEYIDFFS